jgi:hypothetical protein
MSSLQLQFLKKTVELISKGNENKKHMTEHNSDEQHVILTKKKLAEQRYMVTFSCNLLSMRITSYYTYDYRF